MAVAAMSLDELSEADLSRWEELAERALEPNPFFEPAMVTAGARALGRSDVRLLVSVAGGGGWRACVPIESGRGWRRLPIRATASWLGPYSFLGAPLVAPEDAAEGMAELIGSLVRGRRSWFGGLDLFPGDGPLAEALGGAASLAGCGLRRYVDTERAALHRAEPDHLGLSRKHQREAARTGRRLAEELGGDLEATDRAGEDAAVDDFMRLEASGWKGRAGTAFAHDPRHSEFLRGLCRGYAERGRLQLLCLAADGRTVAMKINLLARDTIYCFKIAYDEELARYSPGIQLELENMRRFAADDRFELMDSCAHPRNEMINRLWRGRRPISAIALTRGARSLFARTALWAGAHVRNRMRSA